MPEYITRLASAKHVHVMQLDAPDFGEMRPRNYCELVLTERPGHYRHTLLTCDMDSLNNANSAICSDLTRRGV